MNHSGSPRSSLKARAARARLLQDSSAGPVSSVGQPGVSPDASCVMMGPGSLPSSIKVRRVESSRILACMRGTEVTVPHQSHTEPETSSDPSVFALFVTIISSFYSRVNWRQMITHKSQRISLQVWLQVFSMLTTMPIRMQVPLLRLHLHQHPRPRLRPRPRPRPQLLLCRHRHLRPRPRLRLRQRLRPLLTRLRLRRHHRARATHSSSLRVGRANRTLASCVRLCHIPALPYQT